MGSAYMGIPQSECMYIYTYTYTHTPVCSMGFCYMASFRICIYIYLVHATYLAARDSFGPFLS